MKISHEAYKASKNAAAKEEFLMSFGSALADNKEMGQHMNKLVEDMNPLKVVELFKRISSEVSGHSPEDECFLY
jgi:DNA-directed RNA polymerase III subunit RPC1